MVRLLSSSLIARVQSLYCGWKEQQTLKDFPLMSICAVEMDHLKILLPQKHRVSLVLNTLQRNQRHLQQELDRSQGSPSRSRTWDHRAPTLTLGLGVPHLLSSSASERPSEVLPPLHSIGAGSCALRQCLYQPTLCHRLQRNLVSILPKMREKQLQSSFKCLIQGLQLP